MEDILENGIYLMLAVGLGLNLYVVKAFGKGILNIVFIAFGFCIFFFGASELFSFLKHSGVYEFEEATGHIWWHVMVNLALLSLIWGGYRIKSIVDSGKAEGFGQKDVTFYGVLLAISLGVFIGAPMVEGALGNNPISVFIDQYGLHHLSVFILGAIGGWYLFYIKGQWGLLGTSIMLIVGFLLLVGGQHFWESITETFKLIKLDEEFIEEVELMFVFPATILYALAQWKIIKFIKG